MRKVVLYQLLSFDGVAEEPGDWMFDSGQEVIDNLDRVIGTQDDVLFGRGTYDYWVDYWPTSDFEPFAGFINRTQKHVFTSTPLAGAWENTTPVEEPAAEHVAQLKQGEGGDIGIHGSIGLTQSLWREGLIDVLELVVAPTVAGRGRRLFEHELPAG
jgi:dihydrofolate reductase